MAQWNDCFLREKLKEEGLKQFIWVWEVWEFGWERKNKDKEV